MYTDYGSLWLPAGWGAEGIKASLNGSNISPSYWKEKEVHFHQSEYYMQMCMCQSFGIVWHTWHTWALVNKPTCVWGKRHKN